MATVGENLQMSGVAKLKAPFPYPGGKSKVVDLVWKRLGQASHYVEPFCGSAAMLLGCPWVHKLEVINDQDHFVANFWRAVKHQAQNVADYANVPCIHVELTARHAWLKHPDRVKELRTRLLDAEWEGDAQIAGWWVWCMAHIIGSGFNLNKLEGIPHISNAGRGVGKRIDIHETFSMLTSRLRHVRVINGSWERCLNSNYGSSVSFFFDPPYKGYEKIYDKSPVASEVERWCHENGDNPKFRIALCGFDGDYDLPGWEQVSWKRGAGFRGSLKTANQERIWFSPHCLKDAT